MEPRLVGQISIIFVLILVKQFNALNFTLNLEKNLVTNKSLFEYWVHL